MMAILCHTSSCGASLLSFRALEPGNIFSGMNMGQFGKGKNI